MNDFISDKLILDFFALLNRERINYCLIKNISDELPGHLKDGKDIDIVVDISDRERFAECLDKNGFILTIHPEGKQAGWTFGYQCPEPVKWISAGIEQKLYIDACFMLMCKSLTPNFWIPLDKLINERVFTEKVFNKELDCWQLDEKTLFVYLFVRCVLDKHDFSDEYIQEIEKRKLLLDDADVYAMLQTVFYKFTNTLILLAKRGDYKSIVNSYITFTDY